MNLANLAGLGAVLSSIPKERAAREQQRYEREQTDILNRQKQQALDTDARTAAASIQNQALLRAIQKSQQEALALQRDTTQGLQLGNDVMPGVVTNPEAARVMRLAGWNLQDKIPTATFSGTGQGPVSLTDSTAVTPPALQPQAHMSEMQLRDPYFEGSRATQLALRNALEGNDASLEEIAMRKHERELGQPLSSEQMSAFHEKWLKDNQPRLPFSFVVQTANGPGMVKSGDPNVMPLLENGERAGFPPTAAQKDTALALDNLLENSKLALELGRATNWSGVGALGAGRVKQFMFQHGGIGSQDDEDLRNLLDEMFTDSAFSRGGKQLTGPERQLMSRFLASVSRNPKSVEQSLEQFIKSVERRRQITAPGIPQHTSGQDIPSPAVNAPGSAPAQQPTNRFNLNLPPLK